VSRGIVVSHQHSHFVAFPGGKLTGAVDGIQENGDVLYI
jgi:hypothetical protein